MLNGIGLRHCLLDVPDPLDHWVPLLSVLPSFNLNESVQAVEFLRGHSTLASV